MSGEAFNSIHFIKIQVVIKRVQKNIVIAIYSYMYIQLSALFCRALAVHTSAIQQIYSCMHLALYIAIGVYIRI